MTEIKRKAFANHLASEREKRTRAGMRVMLATPLKPLRARALRGDRGHARPGPSDLQAALEKADVRFRTRCRGTAHFPAAFPVAVMTHVTG